MIIWEKYGFRLKILLIILVLFILLSFILRYFIKFGKIKPSKLTRIFYEDDEQFIKKWGKDREKNKFIYFIATIIKFYLLYPLAILLFIGGDFSMFEIMWPSFLGTLIGYTIGVPVGWAIREDKYIRLTENATVNKDDINQE